jgi:protein-export membrane protein SecD
MWKDRLIALAVLLIGAGIGFVAYTPNLFGTLVPFKLGLDLAGGTHLVYRADTTDVTEADVDSSMEALRNVIERRVNLFGVSEPLVQVEGGFLSDEKRLVVELPGVTDVEEAVKQIGQTPLLEFKLLNEDLEGKVDEEGTLNIEQDFVQSGLTGRYVERAALQFGNSGGAQFANEPIILLTFNSEGAELFEKITSDNVGKPLAIFLDGELISMPTIQEAIPGGTATISGGFTPEEARELVRNLNFGALPLAIELISTETIGASLGDDSLTRGVAAGIYGFILVGIFMIFWYRLPGVIAVIALILYGAAMLALFKLIPVTLTAAGIAAFILSVGMAVDANILIFERTKEELKLGKGPREALREGFARAWLSIRDSNISSMITAVILYWMGGTAIIQGFALVFGIGVLVSMITAISVSRTLLYALPLSDRANAGLARFLLGNGLSR